MNDNSTIDRDRVLDPSGEMSFIGHLTELRRRLIYSLSAVCCLALIGFIFAEDILELVSRPLLDVLPAMQEKMVFTSLPEVFFVHIKLALFVGLLGSVPVIFYQIWRFIACAMHREEKRLLIPFILISTGFFSIGVAFCFFIVFPWAFRFFIGFASESIMPLITLREYIKFITRLLIVFGCIFEMPIAAAFLSGAGLLTPQFLKRNRRYAVLLIFLIAAILTPPDAITQILLAVPMLLLYEMSVWAAIIFSRN
ncbi:twin-arginine translocase subunit TatC [bacterium]|nr:twin-arginine translocase subunit TatC [candidate division CSSED10-310 bacterium]